MSFTLLTIENQRYCILYFYRKGTPQGVSPNQNLIQEKKQIQYISQIFWIAPRQLRLHRATCRLVYNVYNYKLHTGIIVHLYIRLLFSWWCVGREHIWNPGVLGRTVVGVEGWVAVCVCFDFVFLCFFRDFIKKCLKSNNNNDSDLYNNKWMVMNDGLFLLIKLREIWLFQFSTVQYKTWLVFVFETYSI